MRKLLAVSLLALLATGCATAPEPVAAAYVPVGSVQEIAWTPSEPLLIGSTEFPFVPSNVQQIECRTADGARTIEDAPHAVYTQYDRDGVDEFWLAAAIADVIGNAMQDLRTANICRMRTGERPTG